MKYFLSLVLLFFINATLGQSINYDKPIALEDDNFVLGTSSIGGKYQFSSESKLLEQAKQVRSMGSNILKISLTKKILKKYGLKQTNVKTVLELFKSQPDYQKVFDMDFKYVFAWVHTSTGISWKNGINKAQEKILYDEMYELVSFLLKKYKNTGKTFFIGNWEGDWLLHKGYDRYKTPSKKDVENMTKWFNIRQKAIDDAKKDSKCKKVFIYHYIEVNLVLKGMEGKTCIARDILPNVNVDLVSYSSYEAIKNKTYQEKKEILNEIFNFIEKQLPPKENIPFSRRVFLGEYGYEANKNKPKSFEKQYRETKEIMLISFELDLPFALFWQMYNNEYRKGVSREFCLINEAAEKTPLYYLHQNYFKEMNAYFKDYRKKHKKSPTKNNFNQKAIQILKNLK